MKLSVVIPVFCSETIVERLLERLNRALTNLDHEIILVNDCSPDGSWKKIQELSNKYENLKAILLRKNFGYDNALMAGLNRVSGDYIVVMDDDLQHAPEDIPLLLAEIKKGADVVYADFNATKKKQSLFKNIGSWINGKLAEVLIGKPSHIYLSPFKILSRDLVNQIVQYTGPYPYLDGLIFQATAAIYQIPIVHHIRAEGHGNYGFLRSFKILANFCTSHSIFPLRVASLFGFFLSFCAGILGAFLIYAKYHSGFDVEGWASTIFTALLMGGVQLISIGIIGEYVGRSHMISGKAPQFVIRETIGKLE